MLPRRVRAAVMVLVACLSARLTGDPPLPTDWAVMNDGNPIDDGSPIPSWAAVRTVITGDGNLVYIFDGASGAFMGRYNHDSTAHRWELWGYGGGDAAEDVIARRVFPAYYGYAGRTKSLKLFRTPGSNTAFFGIDMPGLVSGRLDLNVHGSVRAIRFDGTRFEHWKGNNESGSGAYSETEAVELRTAYGSNGWDIDIDDDGNALAMMQAVRQDEIDIITAAWHTASTGTWATWNSGGWNGAGGYQSSSLPNPSPAPTVHRARRCDRRLLDGRVRCHRVAVRTRAGGVEPSRAGRCRRGTEGLSPGRIPPPG